MNCKNNKKVKIIGATLSALTILGTATGVGVSFTNVGSVEQSVAKELPTSPLVPEASSETNNVAETNNVVETTTPERAASTKTTQSVDLFTRYNSDLTRVESVSRLIQATDQTKPLTNVKNIRELYFSKVEAKVREVFKVNYKDETESKKIELETNVLSLIKETFNKYDDVHASGSDIWREVWTKLLTLDLHDYSRTAIGKSVDVVVALDKETLIANVNTNIDNPNMYANYYNHINSEAEFGEFRRMRHIPLSVKKIARKGFRRSSVKDNVEIPRHITEIGDEAFYGNGELHTVYMTKTLFDSLRGSDASTSRIADIFELGTLYLIKDIDDKDGAALYTQYSVEQRDIVEKELDSLNVDELTEYFKGVTINFDRPKLALLSTKEELKNAIHNFFETQAATSPDSFSSIYYLRKLSDGMHQRLNYLNIWTWYMDTSPVSLDNTSNFDKNFIALLDNGFQGRSYRNFHSHKEFIKYIRRYAPEWNYRLLVKEFDENGVAIDGTTRSIDWRGHNVDSLLVDSELGAYFSFNWNLDTFKFTSKIGATGHEAQSETITERTLRAVALQMFEKDNVARMNEYLNFEEMPQSVTTIGTAAFLNVDFGEELVIPERITSLGWSSFTRIKTPLKKVTLSKRLFDTIKSEPNHKNFTIYFEQADVSKTIFVDHSGNLLE